MRKIANKIALVASRSDILRIKFNPDFSFCMSMGGIEYIGDEAKKFGITPADGKDTYEATIESWIKFRDAVKRKPRDFKEKYGEGIRRTFRDFYNKVVRKINESIGLHMSG